MTTKHAEIDTALINQKNLLIAKIDSCEDVEMANEAWVYLNFVKQLWIALGYGYKASELRNRLADKIEALIVVEEDFLVNEPKIRPDSRRRTKTHINQLVILLHGVKTL